MSKNTKLQWYIYRKARFSYQQQMWLILNSIFLCEEKPSYYQLSVDTVTIFCASFQTLRSCQSWQRERERGVDTQLLLLLKTFHRSEYFEISGDQNNSLVLSHFITIALEAAHNAVLCNFGRVGGQNAQFIHSLFGGGGEGYCVRKSAGLSYGHPVFRAHEIEPMGTHYWGRE